MISRSDRALDDTCELRVPVWVSYPPPVPPRSVPDDELGALLTRPPATTRYGRAARPRSDELEERRPGRPTVGWAVACALAIAGGAAILLPLSPPGSRSADAPLAAASTASVPAWKSTIDLGSAASTTDAQPVVAAPTGGAAAAAVPVRLRIATLAFTAPITRLATADDGSLPFPADPAAIGWDTRSAPPGLGGATVLTSVGWDGADLQAGDALVVDRMDGSAVTFAVSGVQFFTADALPGDALYGDPAVAGLRLVVRGVDGDGVVVFGSVAARG